MDAGNLWAFMALSIPIIAIVGGLASGVIGKWFKLEARKAEIAAQVAGEQAAQYAVKIERLEEHVAVLTRIVTDRNEGLAAQIETLRDPPKPLTKLN